ncbi:MAG: DEAD/DEAH box helicase [Gemmataceae bacterium]
MSAMRLPPLPVDDVIPELFAHLRSAGAVILRAPTGAGKTTRVPQALVASEWGSQGTVLLLEPRRVAARAAARRMAGESQTSLGREFGYHVRFDKKCGPQTRCLVVTPGILLRMLHDDPYLESVSIVIFDEFHERGIEADLALGLCKLLRESVNALKLIVMSATVGINPILSSAIAPSPAKGRPSPSTSTLSTQAS